MVHHMDFYACFKTELEIRVLWKGKQIGSIAHTFGMESLKYLILAGKRWEVLMVDLEKREILVRPSRGGKVPHFSSSGESEIHQNVHKKIHDLLLSDEPLMYLDTVGKELLISARSTAKSTGALEFDLIPTSNGTFWFPWAGSAALRTLRILGSCYGGFDIVERDIALFFNGATPDEVMRFYTYILADCPPKTEIVQKYGDLNREKYDQYLPENLLITGFAEKYIDTAVAPPKTVLTPE